MFHLLQQINSTIFENRPLDMLAFFISCNTIGHFSSNTDQNKEPNL